MNWSWGGTDSVASIEWGGRSWTLDLKAERPGLVHNEFGPLLALDGLAAPGRLDRSAFSASSLRDVERRFEGIEATYHPEGWGDLRLRATWSLCGTDAIDLLIQLSAQSVDELRQLEVLVASHWPSERNASGHRWVEARDDHAASLSHDGREPALNNLTTLPPSESALRSPRIVASDTSLAYVEMAHPDDVTRRIFEGGKTRDLCHSIRYGLFGYDLEKGVVLRGRLRAAWVPSHIVKAESIRRMAEFLDQPPPLGP